MTLVWLENLLQFSPQMAPLGIKALYGFAGAAVMSTTRWVARTTGRHRLTGPEAGSLRWRSRYGAGRFSPKANMVLLLRNASWRKVTLVQSFERWEGMQRSRQELARLREQQVQGSEAQIRMVEQTAIRKPC